MAKYNEILVGRFNRSIQKLFSMKGPAPVPQLSGDVQVAHSLFSGSENRYLEGWDRFASIYNVTPAAANQSGVKLRNPTGSNVIAVMEKVFFFPSAASSGSVYTGASTTDLAVIALIAGRLDARGRQATALVTSQQNTAVAVPVFGTQIYQANFGATPTGADQILFEDQEWPILPGDAMEVVINTVNLSLTVSFMWRERFLEESERT